MKPLRSISVLILLLALLAGCAGTKKAALSPAAGTWSFRLDAGSEVRTGSFTVVDTKGELTGSLFDEYNQATLPLSGVAFVAPALTFEVEHPDYGTLKAELTLEADAYQGRLSVPYEGSFPIRGQRAQAQP